jgi:hypothetical protein
MKRLPKPPVMVEMLTKLDERFTEKIQLSVISGILRSWPDESECQTLVEEYLSNPEEQWDFAEEYIINLRDISQIKLKCDVIKFCLEYAEQEEFFMEPLVKFETAFVEFDECKILKDSIAVILTVGNILNGGNKTKGQADGFAIEGLPKIITVKDVNNKSGMEYVCKKLNESNPEYTGFKKELRNVYDAKRNNLPELKNLFEAFIAQTNGAKKKCELITNDAEDPAAESYELVVKAKIESYNEKLQAMKKRFEVVENKWLDMGEYYGIKKDDPKMEDTSKFFEFWITFFDGLDKYWPKEKRGKAASSSAKPDSSQGAKIPNRGMKMLI